MTRRPARRAAPASATLRSTLWLYRTMMIDSDGDPLDHGVIRATSPCNPPITLVRRRLREVGFRFRVDVVRVRFYRVTSGGSVYGALATEDPIDRDVRI